MNGLSHPQQWENITLLPTTSCESHYQPENANLLDGNAADLKAECDEYERKIKEAGGIELFVGGIGPDGHIAFNEPGSSLVSRTRVKTLNQVNQNHS